MISKQRWQSQTLAFQIGNIGSELVRAITREKAGDKQGVLVCLERALELLELTVKDLRGGGCRRRELARFKELVAVWFCGKSEYLVQPSQLVDYCLPFAAISRR